MVWPLAEGRMFSRPQKVIIQLVKKSPGTPLRMGTEERDVTEKKKSAKKAETQQYWFPTAAMTNRCKFHSLKEHTFITIEFWRSELQGGYHWARTKVPAGLLSLWRLEGKTCFLDFSSFWKLPEFLGLGPLPPSSKPAAEHRLISL